MKSIYQWLRSKLLPTWMQDKTPDSTHFYRRLFTNSYLYKKQQLIKYWLVFVLFLTQISSPPAVIGLLLIATFLTFAVLDDN